jgi:NADH-quinone oxidoreductase subunit G
MNVVDLCPVGALTSKDFRFSQRVWFLETEDGVCHGCAKNCSITIDHNKLKYKDDIIYRFRPRRNDAINGFYICDTGRLSYKELQENRQETPLLNGVIISEDEAMKQAKDLIFLYKSNINVIIDANLYTEEIEAIVAFAKEIGADVYAPLNVYEDPDFGDDMLKSSMRAANAKTIENMGLNTKRPDKIGLILNFNHPENFESDSQINFLTHTRSNAALTLPIAVFSESSGSLTNEDGITQFSKKAIEKNMPIPTVTEIIEALQR